MSESAVEALEDRAEPPVGHPAVPTGAETGADSGADSDVGRLSALPAGALAVAAGLLTWAAFPGANWWPVAPLGVAALALAARGQRLRRGAWLGMLTGLAFFIPHLEWSGVYVGELPWLALACLEACYVALLGALLTLVWRAPGGALSTVVGTSGLWVAQEALRGRTPFGGFPWGRLAFSQADSPALGYASIGGAPLVTAIVAASGGCLAVAVVALARARRPRAGRVGWVSRVGWSGLAAVAGVGLIVGGAAVPRPTDAARTAEVAAVQGNVPQAGLDFNAQRRAVLDKHVDATLTYAARVRAGAVPAPQVVLWPENSSDIDPLRNPDAATAIQTAVDAVGVPILVGAVLDQPADYLSNAGIVWNPSSGAVSQSTVEAAGSPAQVAQGPGVRYVKRHPAPFSEYIPYRSFFRHFSDKVDLVQRDFWPGDTVGVLPAGGVTLGDVICFEVAYDGLVRDPVLGGADLLVVQTNNATFGYTDESVQQLAMSRLRAVESGRAVVHISTVGVSALIAPDGSIVTRSGHFTQQVLHAALPLRTQQTIATRLGPAPEITLTGLGLLVALVGALRGIRARTVQTSRVQTSRVQSRGVQT